MDPNKNNYLNARWDWIMEERKKINWKFFDAKFAFIINFSFTLHSWELILRLIPLQKLAAHLNNFNLGSEKMENESALESLISMSQLKKHPDCESKMQAIFSR